MSSQHPVHTGEDTRMSVLGFEVEFFDDVTRLTRQLFLKFFLEDNTLEILGEKKIFLGRVFYPDVKVSDLYVGNSITIYSRVLLLRKFANTFTEDYMKAHEFRCFVALRGTSHVPTILQLAKDCDQALGRCVTAGCGAFLNQVSIDRDMIVMEMMGRSQLSSTNFMDKCGTIGPSIQVGHASNAEITEVFRTIGKGVQAPTNSTLCLVKPHIIRDNKLGDVIASIKNEGFTIAGMLSVHLARPMADEVFEDYRSILRNYNEIITEMCKAPVVALMLSGSSDIVENFREFVGPQIPSLAKTVRPDSLRAKFGVDPIRNAVHCTDLAEDGQMESTYFFKTISGL